MLKNVLFITKPENYESFEGFIKRSWNSFFGSICTSASVAFAWMTTNVSNFDLIIVVATKEQLKNFSKSAAVIKRIADRIGLKVVIVDQEKIEEDDLKKVIKENLNIV